MANWQTYNFPDAVRGDSYSDVLFEVKPNNVAADITGATIRMWLIDNKNISSKAEYDTTNGKIVITDAPAGKFKIVFGKMLLAPGVYSYDLEIEFANGIVKTWVKGSLTVLNDKTK